LETKAGDARIVRVAGRMRYGPTSPPTGMAPSAAELARDSGPDTIFCFCRNALRQRSRHFRIAVCFAERITNAATNIPRRRQAHFSNQTHARSSNGAGHFVAPHLCELIALIKPVEARKAGARARAARCSSGALSPEQRKEARGDRPRSRGFTSVPSKMGGTRSRASRRSPAS